MHLWCVLPVACVALLGDWLEVGDNLMAYNEILSLLVKPCRSVSDLMDCMHLWCVLPVARVALLGSAGRRNTLSFFEIDPDTNMSGIDRTTGQITHSCM
jgi:hypothetical protein